MTIKTREQAAKAAEARKTNVHNTCQLVTRGYFGAPSAGDRDKDGDADAVDGWLSEPTSARHTDRKPPRGVPVAWSGGSSGNGHRAISLGPVNGVYMIRSTDAPKTGVTSTVPLSWVEQHWGLHYLGWSDTIDGLPIPKETTVVKPYRVDGTDMHHDRPLTLANLTTARAHGLRFLIHKCSQGLHTVDPKYAARRVFAKQVGVAFGGYHWFDEQDPVKQMEFFLSRLKIADQDWRPSIDFEDAAVAKWSRGHKTDHLGKAVAKVKSEVGSLPIVYTKYDLDDNFDCMLWSPRYSNANTPPNHGDGTLSSAWAAPRIIQFSNGEFGVPKSLPGLTVPMDLNTLVKESPGDPIDWFLVDLNEKPVVKPKPPVVVPPAPVKLVAKVAKIPSKYAKFMHLEPYAFNNSYEGLAAGRKKGYTAVDLDQQVTKDLVIVTTHWGDTREFEKHPRKWSDLTWDQVKGFKSLKGGYQLRHFAQMAARAEALGYQRIEFEAKGGGGKFEGATGVNLFKGVKAQADRIGVLVQVKSLTTIAGTKARLTAALAAGLETIVLPRGAARVSVKKDYAGVAVYYR